MQILRSIVFFIFMVALIPPWVLISFLTIALPVNTAMRIISGWAHSVIWLLKIICGLKHEVTGAENLPNEPVIFACKHQSAWETIALQTFLPPAAWILKRELLWIPIFGWGLACIKPIAINRGDKKAALRSVIDQGIKAHQQGRNIMIFPEGTRTSYGEQQNYKAGAAKLAIATEAKVVPVAHNAGKYWKRHGITKYPGTIKVAIGKPIDTKGATTVEITQTIQNWIEGKLDEWEKDEQGI